MNVVALILCSGIIPILSLILFHKIAFKKFFVNKVSGGLCGAYLLCIIGLLLLKKYEFDLGVYELVFPLYLWLCFLSLIYVLANIAILWYCNRGEECKTIVFLVCIAVFTISVFCYVGGYLIYRQNVSIFMLEHEYNNSQYYEFLGENGINTDQ